MAYLESLFSVAGKTALVTGGASGIGTMISTALVRGGARVLIASRKGADCERVAAEINELGGAGRAEGFAGDVGTEEGVAALAAEISARTPRLDILVNNAGLSWGEPLETFPYRAWARIMDVNVTGLFHLTRALLPLLEAEPPIGVALTGGLLAEDRPLRRSVLARLGEQPGLHPIDSPVDAVVGALRLAVKESPDS